VDDGCVTAVGTSHLFLELWSADQNDNYDWFAVTSLKEGRRGTEACMLCSVEPLAVAIVWTSDDSGGLEPGTWQGFNLKGVSSNPTLRQG